jgi:3-hydroxy acid dehydrogenase / malonic semialdehyde reductase
VRALVIGGSSGYGKGVVDVLRAYHHEVISASRSGDEGHPFELHCDVREPWYVEKAAQDAGALDAVIYSAGIAIGLDKIEKGDDDAWRDVFGTNTLGLLRALRAFIPKLNRPGGIFIHIGSIANNLAYVGGADYCASKAASSSIMRTVRLELLGTGIRTCSIEPGLGNTNFQSARFLTEPDRAAAINAGLRVIQPVDIGHLVQFVIESPKHLNFDEIVVKPLDQATHGKTIKDL